MMIEKEIVTGVTVCIKLLSRFRESVCWFQREIINNNVIGIY